MPSRRRVLQMAGGGLVAAAGATAVSTTATNTSTDETAAWPMARHDPAGTAHSPDASGPKDDAAVAWTARAPGWFVGTSEPMLVDGTVYAAGNGIVAVDAATGEQRFAVEGTAQATPACTAADHYTTPTLATTGTDGLRGLDAAGGVELPIVGWRIGTERWRGPRSPDTTGMYSFGPGSFRGPSPVSVDGQVVAAVPEQGTVVALDGDTGYVVWTVEPDAGDLTDTVVNDLVVRDGTVYVANYPYLVNAYDLATGERRWHRQLNRRVHVTAATDMGVLALTRETVRLLSSADGATVWKYDHGGNVTDSEPAVANGLAFVPDSMETLHALHLDMGKRAWTAEFDGRGSPVVADGVVYATREDYELVAFDAETGRRRFSFTPEQVPLSTPIVSGGRLYAANRNRVLALTEP
ncbi:PQQ-binding-like beta-propeller repeat protein [Salarchaeum japonicum]|uniref:PQQ-binding-like beta-propeller repeat protein n=1 Tax=Salarchaeum japonicum TaxID=555573 RepID=UPI003C72F5A5